MNRKTTTAQTERRSKSAFVVGLRNEIPPEERGLLPPLAAGYDGYAVAIRPATRGSTSRTPPFSAALAAGRPYRATAGRQSGESSIVPRLSATPVSRPF